MSSNPVAWRTEDYETDKSATTYSKEVTERWRAKGWPVWALYSSPSIPEGWMRDRFEVENLADNLESIAWQPDFDGDPVCVDQAAAMSAEVIRKVLLPMLEAEKEVQS